MPYVRLLLRFSQTYMKALFENIFYLHGAKDLKKIRMSSGIMSRDAGVMVS